VDTAIVDPPGQGLYPSATLVWFGRSGDSLNLMSDLGTVQTTIGSNVDSLHNNVPFFSRRLARDGAITIWVRMDDQRGDTVPYTLRVAVPTTNQAGGLRITGLSSKLVLSPDRTRKYAEISIVPVSQVHRDIDRSAWKVFPGPHKVVLTQDSLYEVCVLPCVSADTIKVRPNRAVIWRY